MAIRIRKVNGITVALCAVESDPQDGDLYLDDAIHHALSTKFGLDWQSMGFIDNPPIDEEIKKVMENQKIRDAKQEYKKWAEEASRTEIISRDPIEIQTIKEYNPYIWIHEIVTILCFECKGRSKTSKKGKMFKVCRICNGIGFIRAHWRK
ncbi:MAG: hypothetical protein AABY22_16990 [Nanoarchaeota archaeon]